MDLEERIMELSRYGYACGQILAILLLDTIGEENPALVRCMQGLNGGIGSSGDVCGCMAAGCCMISYFTGERWSTWASTAGISWVQILRKKYSIAPESSQPPMKNAWKSWRIEVCCKWRSEKPRPSVRFA